MLSSVFCEKMCYTDSAIPGAYGAAAPMFALFRSLKAFLLELGDGADWFRVRYRLVSQCFTYFFCSALLA